jgi:hypothetical protein
MPAPDPANLPDVVAQPNQQEQVLRAINNSVSSTVDPLLIVGIVVALVAAALAFAWWQRRASGKAKVRKVLRDPNKLLKSIAGDLQLSPTELRKLKHHAQQAGVKNPLTLLLCPSLAKKAAERDSG